MAQVRRFFALVNCKYGASPVAGVRPSVPVMMMLREERRASATPDRCVAVLDSLMVLPDVFIGAERQEKKLRTPLTVAFPVNAPTRVWMSAM